MPDPTPSGTLRRTLEAPTPEQMERRAEMGSRLKELRRNRQVSQTDLGQAVGISRQSISAWENGRGAPTWDELLVICQFLRCSADFLIRGEGIWFQRQDSLTRINEGSPDRMALIGHISTVLVCTDESTEEVSKGEAAKIIKAAQQRVEESFGEGV